MNPKYLVLAAIAVTFLLTSDFTSANTYAGLVAPAGFMLTLFVMLVMPAVDHYRRDKRDFLAERERFRKYREENWDSPSIDDGMD